MASAQQSKGRGRGRGTAHVTTTPPTPTITIATDELPILPTAENTASSPSFLADDPLSTTSQKSTTDITAATDTRFASNSSNVNQPTTASSTAPRGRGRGGDPKRNNLPPDPFWTVTDLTQQQFATNDRPTKPDQLGTLGQQIHVATNYFPVLHFPQKGLVYKYHILIRNKKNLDIHRDRRRIFYHSWLLAFCRQHPQVSKNKIVFDNQSTIFSFDQPLPDITENTPAQIIDGPNRSNRQEPHRVIVQRVGTPVDLALIRNLNELFDPSSLTNERIEDLQEVKQVLSVALHEHCSSQASFVFTRSFFTPSTDGHGCEWDLGLGKAVWRGFYSCLVFSKGKHQLLMNLDVKHSVFMKKQSFLDFVREVMVQSPSGKPKYSRQRNVRMADSHDVLQWLDVRSRNYRNDAEFLLKHCKHLRVRSQAVDKPISYEIVKLGRPASEEKFHWKQEKREVTIKEYYNKQYNVELEYPSLPTLEMRNGSFLPMELVDVEPVRVKKVTDEQRATMCRVSTMKPFEYERTISDIRADPKKQCFEADPFVAAWQMNVDVKMVTVPARVLPMPVVVYGDSRRVTSREVKDVGTWEPRGARFHKPSAFPRLWAMINLSRIPRDDCEQFYIQLSGVARQHGMQCIEPELYEEFVATADRSYSIEKVLDSIKETMNKNQECKFFIVILPSKSLSKENKEAYRDLKKLCELDAGVGIVTQMIQEKNACKGTKTSPDRWDLAKLSNILLKINTKLDGINSILEVPPVIERFFTRGHRIMYVGADLSHPAPGATMQPSVVAVVASADDIPNRYFKEVYQQFRPPQTRGESREHIVSLKQIMKSLISQYTQHRGFPPNAIVFYRDGISESEFDSVFDKELTSIREACVELSPVYRPYLTYIVVSKRHHTKLYPSKSDKNVPAGTVVDSSDITNPTKYDFYLCSHHGALGTSRPTHYYVLYDDNKLKPDEVQMLTYALCYTFARCTRSVSIPAPVKYADLLAIRATLYIKSDDQSDTESVSSEARLPVNQSTNVEGGMRSERIVLSSRIAPECPFFL